MTQAAEHIYVYVYDQPSHRTWKASIDLAGFLEAAAQIMAADDTDKLKISTMLALRIEDLLRADLESDSERELLEGDVDRDQPGLFHLGALHAGVRETTYEAAKNCRSQGHYIIVRYQTAMEVHLRGVMLPPDASAMPGIMTRETLLATLMSIEEEDLEYLKTLDAPA